jgi:hypothetical protein
MLFYRVENNEKKGPYRFNSSNGLQQHICKDSDKKLNKYLQTHPGPWSDPLLKDIYYKKGISDFIFGFESLEKVKAWFCLKAEIKFLKANDFHISVYKVSKKKCYHGKWQSIANKNALKLVKIMEF